MQPASTPLDFLLMLTLGVQLLACNHGPERHQTHDFMVHEINSCAKACGLYSKTERTNFFRSVSTDNGKRPDLEIRGLDQAYLGYVMITDSNSTHLNGELNQRHGDRTCGSQRREG